MQIFQTKIELREASWRPPGFQIWKKEHLSFHWKKNNYPSILFRKNFRFCNISAIKKRVGTYFQMCYIVVFSAFFERKSKLQTKIQLRKASWRPPGGFRFEKSNITAFTGKKIILVSVYLNLKKLKFCNVSFIRVRYGTDFQRCHICRFFNKNNRFQNVCVYKFLFCLKKKPTIVE